MKKQNKDLLIKQRAILNATQDLKLVRTLSKLSTDQLFNEYGIKIPKRLPRVKQFPSNLSRAFARKRFQEQLEKFQYAKQKGFTTIEARRIKGKKRIEIDKLMKGQKLIRDAIGGMTTKAQRMKQWATWTNKDNKGYQFPKEYEFIAKEINRRKGLKAVNGLGYAAVYYSFVNGTDIETEMTRLQVDKFDSSKYKVLATI